MAKHEITVYQNTGATKETAPYIGSYISKETLRLDGFKAKISERCGLPAIQVQAILAGAFDAIEALEKESLVRVHLDGFTVCGIITGSFPTADAAFNKDKNALQMAVRLDEPIRNALADVTPTVITDASLTKLRVDNVMDLAAPRPYNVIHGKHVFRVAGFNMVLSDEGAEAYLENSRGTKFPLVIDEVVTKQLFKAHTETLLEPGDYKLVVKSKAGDAEGPLQTDYRRVKYLEVIDPPTRRFTFENMRASTTDGNLCIMGNVTNLEGVAGHRVDESEERPLHYVKGEVLVNGESRGEVEFHGYEPEEGGEPEFIETEEAVFDRGDTVKVVFRIDPAKTDFDQTPVEAESVAD